MLKEFFKDESGVTAIEYAVIGVAMAAVLTTVFAPSGTFGKAFQTAFKVIADGISGNVGPVQ